MLNSWRIYDLNAPIFSKFLSFLCMTGHCRILRSAVTEEEEIWRLVVANQPSRIVSQNAAALSRSPTPAAPTATTRPALASDIRSTCCSWKRMSANGNRSPPIRVCTTNASNRLVQSPSELEGAICACLVAGHDEHVLVLVVSFRLQQMFVFAGSWLPGDARCSLNPHENGTRAKVADATPPVACEDALVLLHAHVHLHFSRRHLSLHLLP